MVVARAPVVAEVAQESVRAEVHQASDRGRVLVGDAAKHRQHLRLLGPGLLEVEPLEERAEDGQMAAHVRGAQQAVVELERERGEGALANVEERVTELLRQRLERRPGRAVVRHGHLSRGALARCPLSR